jgi:hypothetical protein
MCGCASESARRLALGWPVSLRRQMSPAPARRTLSAPRWPYLYSGRGAGHQCDLCMLFRLCAVALLATPRPVSRETVTQHDFKTFLEHVLARVRRRFASFLYVYEARKRRRRAVCSPACPNRRLLGARMPPPSYHHCTFCGQMFGSASLPIHLRRCRSQPKDKPVAEAAVKAALAALHGIGKPIPTMDSGPQSPTTPFEPLEPSGPLEPCCHCGRTFHSERLEKHQRSCVAGKPSRARPARRVITRGESPRPSRWRQQHEDFMSVVRGNKRHTKPLMPSLHGGSPEADGVSRGRRRTRSSTGSSASALYLAHRLGGSAPSRGGCFSSVAASPTRFVGVSSAASSPDGPPPRDRRRPATGGASPYSDRYSSPMRAPPKPAAALPLRRLTPAQRHATEWYDISTRRVPSPSLPPPPTLAPVRVASSPPSRTALFVPSRPSSPSPMASIAHARDLLNVSHGGGGAPFSNPFGRASIHPSPKDVAAGGRITPMHHAPVPMLSRLGSRGY